MARIGGWRGRRGRCPPRSNAPDGIIKEYMMYLRNFLLLCSATCLLAQTPPPIPVPGQAPPAQAPAAQVPLPIPPKGVPPDRVVNPDGSITMKVPIGPSFAQVPPDRVVVSVGDLTITAKQFDEITDGIQDQYKAF